MTPINNGEVIRINVPPLTEERRHQLVKQVKSEGETAKISVRTGRKWFLDELKTLAKDGLPEDEEKNGEKIIQDMTDKHISRIDKIVEAKEKEILTV
jgi:ribosome recycling factor